MCNHENILLLVVPDAVNATTIIITSGTTSLTLNWTEPDQRNGPITDYKIEWRFAGNSNKANSPWNSNTTDSGQVEVLTIDRLKSSAFYEVRVAALNKRGLGKYSDIKKEATGIAGE